MEEKLESNARNLLTDVAETINSFEAKWQKTGEKYNLFKIAGIAHKEVIMCRVLIDLLDPKGKHCQGSLYLRLFWETISPKLPGGLKLSIDEDTKVTAEYGTDENRRIDITLYDGRFFVPIEVKIRAGDQQKQVADYYKYAREINKDKDVKVPLLYLTLDGHEPSDFSKVGIGKEDYVTLSFKDDILAWLEECWGKTPKTTVPVCESLRQLTAAIKSLCDKSEDKEMEDAIFKLITENTARAAMEIRKVADFDNRAWETFKGPVLEKVREEFKDASWDVVDKWKYLYVPINGRYWFEIDYLWDIACVQAIIDAADAVSAEGKALCEKMSELLGKQTSPINGNAWFKDGITWVGDGDGFAKDDLYEFHLCKLYTDNPQEVAERIIKIVKELNDVKA